MVVEILPFIGAAIPLTAYALKRDTERKKELEIYYGKIVERNDLTQNGMVNCLEEIESFKSLGIRTFLKKREYVKELKNKIIDKRLGVSTYLKEALRQSDQSN